MIKFQSLRIFLTLKGCISVLEIFIHYLKKKKKFHVAIAADLQKK